MSRFIAIYPLVLFLAMVPAKYGDAAEASLAQQLADCAALGTDQARLACYDALARKMSSETSHAQSRDFIQPPAAFLDSQLVAEAWNPEYTLTVRSFVDLIAQAVLENRQPVTVQGWSRDRRDYVLHITMKTPVKLHFLPRDPAGAGASMSLLRDVKMDGYTLGADQFILIIAAMVPDKKTDNNSTQ